MNALLTLLLLQAAPAEVPAPPQETPLERRAASEADALEAVLPSVLDTEPLVDRLARPVRWGQVRLRERLLSFNSYSARSAALALDGVVVDAQHRATALMALGCSRSPGARTTLESWAVGGGSLEQRAAILALGELGGTSVEFLEQLTAAEDPLVAESALFALLRQESAATRAIVESIANETGRRNRGLATALLAFVDNPASVTAPESVKLLFELRWDAALEYGLIGGKSLAQLRIEELESNPAFLRAVVLRSCESLSLAGVDDHLLGLLEEGGTEVVRAAVRKLPRTLTERFAAGKWKPRGNPEWTALLEAVEELGARRDLYPVVKAAAEMPAFRLRAAALMLAMGDESAPSILREALYDTDLETRILACRGFGATTDARWAGELAKLRREDEPRLSMAALVAQMRMGYQPADKVVRSIVLEGERDVREQLVRELLEVARDSRVPPLLEAAFPHLLGRLRLRAAAELVSRGFVLPRTELVAALEAGLEPDLAPRFVRALATVPGFSETQALARLFPSEGLELNTELALALVKTKHAIGISLLKRALWSPPLDLSALAAGLLVDARGIAGLHQELDSPPPRVTQSDIRRVGFALGEWGGVEALEVLAERRPSHDPALQGAYLGAMSARTQ